MISIPRLPISYYAACQAAAAAVLGRVIHIPACMQISSFMASLDFYTIKVSAVFKQDFSKAYAISYKASRYLALPCLMADLYRGYGGNQNLSVIHLVSGIVPFAMALSGKDDVQLGNLCLACNIVSLAYYSFDRNREWGWYTAGAALIAFFVVPQSENKLFYPLGLALLEHCAYSLFYVHFDH